MSFFEQAIDKHFFRECENLDYLERRRLQSTDDLFDIIKSGSDEVWVVRDPESPELSGRALWAAYPDDSYQYIGPEELRYQAHKWIFKRAINADTD